MMEGSDIVAAEAIIDNGRFGKRTVRFETGRLAKQAAGSALAYLDDSTTVLSATTVGKNPKDQFDFFPLTVDVEERQYAAGRIPGSFFRREGRAGTEAILAARLIDRPLRPGFVKGLRNEVQVVETVLTIDPDDAYDVLAINAASMSTQIAGLPFTGPIGGTRLALIDDQWVAFPRWSELERSVFNIVVAGRIVTKEDGSEDVAIMMVEAGGGKNEWELIQAGATAPTEDVVADGLEAAKPFIKALCEAQLKVAEKASKETAEFPLFLDYTDEEYAAVEEYAAEKIAQALLTEGKLARDEAVDAVKEEMLGALAERFPDKQFSTLAYLFTMHPPKHVKPLPNVNIMLCDIDTKREVPLTDNESGRDFVRALEGWAKISNNIFVWDYGINFDNVVAPFPNFHILKKNIQLFKRNHATMLFEQVNGTLGTDFAELRAYMLGKLMWNSELDADSLMQRFMRGYYGAAAPYLYRYQQMLTGALLASGTPLWIYDSPITHKNGMLNANLRKAYNELFDEAEKAVAADSAMLAHVCIARLPLRYSELEIARTESGGDKAAVEQSLDTFGTICAQYGVPTLNERNNKVEDYCRLYRQRFLPNGTKNKAAGAKVIWNIPPQKRYQPIADKALTDGLYGGTTFVESWVGWQGEDADFVLDMGEQKQVNKITTDFLHQLGQWILQPKSVAYYASDDAKNFRLLGTHEFPEDRDISVKFVPATVTLAAPVQARYIRVVVKTLGLCQIGRAHV